MIPTVADLLPVFVVDRFAQAPPPFADLMDRPVDAIPEGVTEDEVERRVAEARCEAEAEAAAALEAALEAQAAELESRHAASLAEARQAWADEQGAVLARSLQAELVRLEASLMESLVLVLEPFVAEAMRLRASEELRIALGALIAHRQGARITVRGPRDLIDALRQAFPGEGVLDVEEAEEAEVTIECEDTTIRSQLQAWADTLRSYLDEVRR